MVAYLTNGLLGFGLDMFQRDVIVPTWSTLNKANKSINWSKLLGKPSNIFNSRLIDKKLAEMTTRKQVTLIRALNKLSI